MEPLFCEIFVSIAISAISARKGKEHSLWKPALILYFSDHPHPFMLALLCASSGLAVGSKSFVSKPFVRRCSALTLKDEDGSWSLKSSVPMPDKLAEWGCDDTLWSQVRSKQPLIDFAEAGDENAARERIAMLRASPSITGAGAHAPLPENIASMGCDAELWSKVRSKQALIDLAAGGNEEQVRSQAPSLILTSSCPWR